MNEAASQPENSSPGEKGNSVTLGRIIKSKGTIVVGGFIISLLLLVMTAKKINWQLVHDAFTSATWLPWLPLAVVTYLIGMLLRGLRLKQLVSTEASLTVSTASNIIAVGYATNNILPARLGEFARAGMLAERTGLPYALSLTVTFLERLLDGLTILSLFVLAIFVTPTDQWLKPAAMVAGLLFGCAIPSVLMLAFAPQLSLSLASQFSIPLGRKWHNRALALVTQVTRGLSCLRDAPTALSVLATSFLIWIIEGLMFALVMPCFNLPINLVKAIAVMAFTNLGILVPSSPGYIGTYHVCCKTALLAVTGSDVMQTPTVAGHSLEHSIGHSVDQAVFQTYQLANMPFLSNSMGIVSESTALSYAVVVHLVFYTTVTIWGVIAMARYGLELGTTAALAWQAKPITNLPEADTMAVITSVPTPTRNNHCFRVNQFWLAIVASSLPTGTLVLSSEERGQAVNYATEFVCSELSALPSSLRVLFKLGILGFRSITIITNLCPFENLSSERQAKIINTWSYGPIGLTRKLFKPLRSLALLAFFEHPAVVIAIDKSNDSSEKFKSSTKAEK
ncbi:flippase-like domain-containing protein [bacterium]|nr:flippase-like domain-containing protein [bacterium]